MDLRSVTRPDLTSASKRLNISFLTSGDFNVLEVPVFLLSYEEFFPFMDILHADTNNNPHKKRMKKPFRNI